MPYDYKLCHEKRLVNTTISRSITAEEVLQHNADIKKLFDDGILDESWMQLTQYKDAVLKEKKPVDMVRTLAKKNPWPAACARVVVTEHKFIFALGRVYQQLAYSGENGMRVMRSLEEAEAYLAECRSKTSPPADGM
ncbi:hypothetical protein P0Y35_17480 [Kiritimatiellaeota bacterium B1221]|nr:hypothetical protein [Kiritimatiellaeota bacterium B1221]